MTWMKARDFGQSSWHVVCDRMRAMERFLQDTRYAIRSLLRQPGFAATAILTLALGIGATTGIFSAIDGIVLRPLPYPRADRIVAVGNYWTKTGLRSVLVSAPDFHDWESQNHSFSAIAYYIGGEISVTVNGTADYAAVYRTTPAFFDVLGARAQIGRLLTAEEQKPGGPSAVVITDGFWRRQFNGDPAAIGRTVKFNDTVFTISGVLDRGIRFPVRADIYMPSWRWPETTERGSHNYSVIARLRDGVSLEQAREDMTAIATRLAAEYPNSNATKLTFVIPLQDQIVGTTKQTLYLLFGAVGLVLLIACANVANLLLARSTAREREMVVRAAVGASRARLVRQLLTESAVLGIAAGAIGAWCARLAMLGLVRIAPANLPRLDEVHVDGVALAFAVAMALIASFLFGLAPAVQVSRVQLVDGLRQGGKGSSIGARGGFARSVFVVAEIALAVVLVAGAGLLARSLAALMSVDLGFVPDRMLILQTNVPVSSARDAGRATEFYRSLLTEIRGVPGVSSIAAVRGLPTSPRSNGGYWLEGGPGPDQTGVRAKQAIFTVVTPDYFRTMQIPIKVGRDFTERDRSDAPFVAIVNEALAKQAFPGVNPIGKRIECGLDSPNFMAIVGVVGDVRTNGPALSPGPEIYMPFEQHPNVSTSLTIVARTAAPDPLALTDTLRRKISARNPDVPVKATTMTSTLESASATTRFQTFLLLTFAAVALMLAMAGVYGVMAYTVNQRIPELGVRIALGATPETILGLVMGQGARLSALGLSIGVALALVSGRALNGVLFGVTPHDPAILAAVSVVVAIATLAACYIPGRRALRVDPVVAMRAE
jgi:putative ABC transport system permease protein